jgi:hypothetical protein
MQRFLVARCLLQKKLAYSLRDKESGAMFKEVFPGAKVRKIRGKEKPLSL